MTNNVPTGRCAALVHAGDLCAETRWTSGGKAASVSDGAAAQEPAAKRDVSPCGHLLDFTKSAFVPSWKKRAGAGLDEKFARYSAQNKDGRRIAAG
jgi:hypothetical protein